MRENVLGKSCQALFVDFHGEATSEKYSFAHHFDGRVSAVIGTHTHAPTADTHILSGGTAYQSDAGMTGDYDSVIGVRKDIAIQRFLKKMPGKPLIPASENKTLCGVFIVTDDRSGKAVSVDPVRVGIRCLTRCPRFRILRLHRAGGGCVYFFEIAHTGVIQSFDEFVAILTAVSFNFGCYDRLDGGVEGLGDFESVEVDLVHDLQKLHEAVGNAGD